jgi:hypothetical protein
MEDLLIPLFGIVVPFATLFGIVYIIYTTRHRERMSMIGKGMDPNTMRTSPEPLRAIRNGLVMLGLGIGLVAGWLFHQYAMDPTRDTALPYFAGPAIFVGLALTLYYARFGRKQQG